MRETEPNVDSRFPFLEHPRPIALAHRGGAEEGPENTMAAFENAVRLGFRYIETDVQVTRDGVALAFHDERLERVHLVGSSYGGEFVWRAALNDPDLVAGLVLIDSSGYERREGMLPYALLVLMLIVRPRGLFGTRDV